MTIEAWDGAPPVRPAGRAGTGGWLSRRRRRRAAAAGAVERSLGPQASAAELPSPGALELSVSVRHRRAVVVVHGDVDGDGAPRLLDTLQGVIDAGARSVVVDLAAGDVTDPAALAAIAGARGRLDRRHGELVLKSPRYRTLRLLATTGLDGVIPIC